MNNVGSLYLVARLSVVALAGDHPAGGGPGGAPYHRPPSHVGQLLQVGSLPGDFHSHLISTNSTLQLRHVVFPHGSIMLGCHSLASWCKLTNSEIIQFIITGLLLIW